jgi:hypothetical protein
MPEAHCSSISYEVHLIHLLEIQFRPDALQKFHKTHGGIAARHGCSWPKPGHWTQV